MSFDFCEPKRFLPTVKYIDIQICEHMFNAITQCLENMLTLRHYNRNKQKEHRAEGKYDLMNFELGRHIPKNIYVVNTN